MQEHDDIDGLFKSGLENFKPDASHLSYGPLAQAIGAKTTVAATTAAKSGFFAKWGMTMYFGLTTVAAGTGVAIVYAPDHVAVEANSKTILAASVQLKEELLLLGELPVTDSVLVNHGQFSSVEEETVSTVESNESVQTKQGVSTENATFKTVVSDHEKETTIAKQQPKQRALLTKEAETVTAHETKLQPEFPSEIINRKANAIQSNVVAKSMTELPLKTQKPVQEQLQSLPVDSILVADATRLEEIIGSPLTATDSVDNTMSRVVQQPSAMWAESRFSIRAGLGYAPLRTSLVVNQEEYIDSLFFFEFYQNVIDRPSIKNEFSTSISYQKRLKSNLQLGVGLSYLQGGWKSFTDHSHYYYADNGLGDLYLVTDTVRVGERNITANCFSLNLFTGYDFVLNEKWMIGATIGLNLNQLFVQNDFRNYSTNEVSTVKKADFVIGAYGAVDLNYYMTSRFGLSIGASINGRANVAKAMGAGQFYNNASFGLNAGIHYFIVR